MIYIFNIGDIIETNKIIEKDIEKTKQLKRSYWKCECLLCHNIRSVRNDNLNQKCRSCAAKSRVDIRVLDDLTDRTFGNWKVLSKSNKSNYWSCQCLKCGVQRDVFRGNLTSGASKGCGCVNSWGETQITYLLNQFNIPFQKEYTFTDLRTDKNGTPRFDFAIFQQNGQLLCLIEFDGRQHFQFDSNWKFSENDFNRLQYIDNLKNDYCLQKNITLYRLNQNTNLEKFIKEVIKNDNEKIRRTK